MAVSTKFYNFNKRPHNHGFLGATLPDFRKWTVYTSCINNIELTLYTNINIPLLIIGVIIYTDSELSSLFTGSFYVAGNQYTVVAGSITLITFC